MIETNEPTTKRPPLVKLPLFKLDSDLILHVLAFLDDQPHAQGYILKVYMEREWIDPSFFARYYCMDHFRKWKCQCALLKALTENAQEENGGGEVEELLLREEQQPQVPREEEDEEENDEEEEEEEELVSDEEEWSVASEDEEVEEVEEVEDLEEDLEEDEEEDIVEIEEEEEEVEDEEAEEEAEEVEQQQDLVHCTKPCTKTCPDCLAAILGYERCPKCSDVFVHEFRECRRCSSPACSTCHMIYCGRGTPQNCQQCHKSLTVYASENANRGCRLCSSFVCLECETNFIAVTNCECCGRFAGCRSCVEQEAKTKHHPSCPHYNSLTCIDCCGKLLSTSCQHCGTFFCQPCILKNPLKYERYDPSCVPVSAATKMKTCFDCGEKVCGKCEAPWGNSKCYICNQECCTAPTHGDQDKDWYKVCDSCLSTDRFQKDAARFAELKAQNARAKHLSEALGMEKERTRSIAAFV